MSQKEKAEYYRELKDAGVNFDKHYREYSTAELKAGVEALRAGRPQQAEQSAYDERDDYTQSNSQLVEENTLLRNDPPQFDPAATAAAYAQLQDEPPAAPTPPAAPPAPVAQANPSEMPGTRLNTKPEDEPIRVDEHGLVWYQEEVRKPAFPKPRGRRVLQYMESGTKTETVQNGEYVETFEVAGEGAARPAQVKITLPSYQVGIYKDPRFPFKIHTYNGNRGFDLFEVQNFYGGSELVPAEIKRVYVENVLCYDIRTTVRAIQSEYRQMQLAGKVK